jgi:hypothetical protein
MGFGGVMLILDSGGQVLVQPKIKWQKLGLSVDVRIFCSLLESVKNKLPHKHATNSPRRNWQGSVKPTA